MTRPPLLAGWLQLTEICFGPTAKLTIGALDGPTGVPVNSNGVAERPEPFFGQM